MDDDARAQLSLPSAIKPNLPLVQRPSDAQDLLGPRQRDVNAPKDTDRPLPHRIEALDALRGVASLWVVLHHSWAASTYAMASEPITKLTPLRLLFGARPPVIFFFVLSGFVLTLACNRPGTHHYVAYLARRICRIYLPFIAVLLLSAIAGQMLAKGPIIGATSLINNMWNDVSFGLVMRHVLMTGLVGQTELDQPMWSLVQELRISVVFPAMIIFVQTMRLWLTIFLTSAIFLLSWKVLSYLGQDSVGYYSAISFVASFGLTVFFLLPFVVGIIVALHRERLQRMVRSLGRWSLALLWAGVGMSLALTSYSPAMDLVFSVAAGVLIVLTLNSGTAQSLLNTASMQWLGRVSYSLYLVHLPVLAAMAYVLAGVLPFGYVALIAPCMSLIVANVVNVTVEVPAMRLGRRLGAALPKLRPHASNS